MASPKKRTSKQKKNIRKHNWKAKAAKEALKALAIGKQILNPLNSPSLNSTNTAFKITTDTNEPTN